MHRWAEIEDDAKLDKAVAGLPQEVKKQVSDLRTTAQILKIQRVSPLSVPLYPFSCKTRCQREHDSRQHRGWAALYFSGPQGGK